MNYQDFLRDKQFHAPSVGFTPKSLNPFAFPWQRPVIEYACRKGRSAMWEGCGMQNDKALYFGLGFDFRSDNKTGRAKIMKWAAKWDGGANG